MIFKQSLFNIDEDTGSIQPVLILSNPSSTSIIVEVLNIDESATGEYCVTLVVNCS